MQIRFKVYGEGKDFQRRVTWVRPTLQYPFLIMCWHTLTLRCGLLYISFLPLIRDLDLYTASKSLIPATVSSRCLSLEGICSVCVTGTDVVDGGNVCAQDLLCL